MNARVDSPSKGDERWYWICQLVGWGLIFAVQVLGARIGNWPWQRAIPEMAGATLLLLGATHLVRRGAHLHNWFALPYKALARRAFFISAGISVALILMLAPIEILLYGDRRLVSGWTTVLLIGNLCATLLLWHIFYFGAVLIRQRQQSGAEEAKLRAALRTAELNLLKSQLNPHFLFNALNTVRALIVESPDRAQLAVTQLARTLRYALNSSRDELVTLENELGIVDDYLGIETLRLAERLSIQRQIADNALAAHIPIMLLQTLVENAIKHGISQLPQGGTLRIAANIESNTLVIVVGNDRPLIKNANVPSDRVGLANANERLRLMIGGKATLKLDLSDPHRAIATVRIPQKTANKRK